MTYTTYTKKDENMEMLRTKIVAERLGVTRKTVWNMIQRGAFPNARKVDPGAKSLILIPETDVEKLIAKQVIGKGTM